MTTTKEKLAALREALQPLDTLAIAFSGGVDSTLLLKIAVNVLGPDRVVAMTVKAENFPAREHREALAFASSLGVKHIVINCDLLALPEFVENSPDRCYFCKKMLFGLALDTARAHGCRHMADGANTDDAGDYRPGTRAAAELGVLSPLRDAGLGKREIRQLLQALELPIWEKPSFACLASRFPYGTVITSENLARVEQAENYLLGLGFKNVRVRHHGDIARIEVDPDERARFFTDNLFGQVDAALRGLGYLYIALDLHGYRTGSMNAPLMHASTTA